MFKKQLLPLLFLLPLFAHSQTTWYVRANALGQNTGHSWADAYNNLHTALQTAQPGDAIWVSEGIYHTADNGDRSAFFDVKSGLALYGGFTGVETNLAQRDWEVHPVILDGDIGVPGDSTDNTRNLVRMVNPSAQTILDGFVLRNAVADDPDAPYQGLGASGAALYIDAGSGIAYPLIRHCRFERNSTIGNGGAAFIKSGTTGMVAPRFVDCRFERNHANAGGAVYRLGSTTLDTPDDFRDCYFYKNISNGYGSGIFYGDVNGRTDTLDVIHCIFDENEARSQITIPAGVFYTNGRSNGACLRFVGCRMRKNSSKSGSGIAYYSEDNPIKYFMVDSCLFDGNYTFQWNPSIAGLSIGMYSGYYDGVFKSNIIIRNSSIINQDYKIIEISLIAGTKVYFENNIFRDNFNSHPPAGAGITIEADSVIVKKNLIVDNYYSYCSVTGSKYAICEYNIVYNGSLNIGGSSQSASLIYNNIFDGANRTNAFGVAPKNIYIGNLFINNRYKIPLLPGYVPPAPQRWKMYNNIFINNHNTESGAAAQYYQYLPFYQDSVDFYNNSFDFPSCDVLGGKANCVSGNLFGQDLMLADTANRDYRLLPCSPAINAGINDPYTLYNILKDYYDQPRILDGLADIGPIESPGLSLGAAPLIHAACPDSNSGSVDFVLQNGCEPFQYQWTHSNTSGTNLSGLEAGDYAFTITDQTGKTFAVALNLPLVQAPVVTANVSAASCSTCASGAINLEVTGVGTFEYQWNTGATTASVLDILPGTYTVTITISDACTEVRTYIVPFTNAVGDIEHSVALQIRPNPANQQTQINWSTTYPAETVTLYNCLGRSVLQFAVEAGASSCAIPTDKLPDGVYWCRLQGRNGLVMEGRMAVQH